MAEPQQVPEVTTTASRCAVETALGTHTFEIADYSMHKGMGAGNFIRSAAFAVGGHRWCIRYYRDGVKGDKYKDYSAFLLELLSQRSEVRASYVFKLVAPDTKSPRRILGFPTRKVFSTMDTSKDDWGVYIFLLTSLIEEYYVDKDCLVIQCDITVIKPALVGKATMESVSKLSLPPTDLPKNLKKLLEDEEETDVTFTVKGEVFRAHRILLAAQSPVFKAELIGQVGESNRDIITIEDIQPAVFKALLEFIYTGAVASVMEVLDGKDIKDFLKHLLVAADRYALETLKQICETILCRCIDVQTVADTLLLAEQYNCRKLKDVCIEYINSSNAMDHVKTSQGYELLKRECPTAFIDMWEKATKRPKT